MKSKQLKLGALMSYFNVFLTILFGLIYTPFVLRILGKSEYGIYNLASTAIAYLMLLTVGFNGSYLRYYSKYKASDEATKIKDLNGLFLTVYSILGGVAFVLGIIISFNSNWFFGSGLTSEEYFIAKMLMILMTINVAFSFPAKVFDFYMLAHERFILIEILKTVRSVFLHGFAVLVLLFGFRSIGVISCNLVINLIFIGFNMFYCLKCLKMQFNTKKFNFALFLEILIFSSFIAMNMIVDQINLSVGKILVGRFHGPELVSVLAIGFFLYSLYVTFSTSISAVLVPRINLMVARNCSTEELTLIMTKVARYQIMILTLVVTGFVIFGKSFIGFWAGPGYETAYYAALMLMIPATIPLIQNIGIEIQKAQNKHMFRSIVMLIFTLFNLAISIPLTKEFDILGAVIGTSFSLFVVNGVVMNAYYKNNIGINILYFWAKTIKLMLALLIPFLIFLIPLHFYTINSIVVLALLIVIYTCLYLCCLFFFCLNYAEKKAFIGFTKKLFATFKNKKP